MELLNVNNQVYIQRVGGWRQNFLLVPVYILHNCLVPVGLQKMRKSRWIKWEKAKQLQTRWLRLKAGVNR